METGKQNSPKFVGMDLTELQRLYQQGKISRRAFLRGTAILGAAGLAACVPTHGTAAPPTSASVSPIAPTTAPVVVASPTTPAPKVLRCWNGLFGSFDIDSTGSYMIQPDSLMYEWLVRYKGGTADVEPWLAKSWDISPDSTSVTFHLQQGVQWQKGYGEFTADDVKFTIERIVSQKLPEAPDWTNLDHVEAVDKYTAKIVMKSPSPTLFTCTLPFQGGMMMCKAAVTALGAKAFNETPVGTGPYELVSYVPNQSMDFKPFPQYWGTRVLNADQVTFLLPADPITALQAGDIDIAAAAIKQVANAKQVPSLATASRLGMFWWISLPCTDPILQDINARKAIRAALDIDAIIEASGMGAGVRGYAMVPPGLIGYWKDAPHYTRDVNQAKQFLQAAGHPNGFTVPFIAMSNPPDPGVEVIRTQLAEVGITLNVNSVDSTTYWSMVTKGNAMSMLAYGTLPDGDYTLQYFTTGQYWNCMKWTNKQFDDLYEKSTSEMDPTARAQLLVQMQKVMDDDVAIVMVGYQPRGAVYRPGVVSFGPNDEALLIDGVIDTSRLRMI